MIIRDIARLWIVVLMRVWANWKLTMSWWGKSLNSLISLRARRNN